MICKKVYSAKEYKRTNENNYRIPEYIEINSPEVLPTLNQNDGKFDITIHGNYFKNKNYPIGSSVVSSHNSFLVKFMRGTKIPTYIPKRMPLLLVSHTDKIEDAFVIMA